QIQVHVYPQENSMANGISSQTLGIIPKLDWCRIVFVVLETKWQIYLNCLKTFNDTIFAEHRANTNFYHNDLLGTYVIGGSEVGNTFLGYVGEVKFYRRIALTQKQFPKRPDLSKFMFNLHHYWTLDVCKSYLQLYDTYQEQFKRLENRIRTRNTCSRMPYLTVKNRIMPQCLLIKTWKRSRDMNENYRVYRAIKKRIIAQRSFSKEEFGTKLYDLTLRIIQTSDFNCPHIARLLEQSTCYGSLQAQTTLAMFYNFGLCFVRNSTM
ncbi:unnamed protein product, partial [Didymodactylos carnosus]